MLLQQQPMVDEGRRGDGRGRVGERVSLTLQLQTAPALCLFCRVALASWWSENVAENWQHTIIRLHVGVLFAGAGGIHLLLRGGVDVQVAAMDGHIFYNLPKREQA